MLQKKKSMSRLIERLRFSDFSSPEPNPFIALDRMKQEFGELFRENGQTDGQDDENGSDVDDDDEEDEEDDDEGGGTGLLDYLTACSLM